MDTAQLEQRLIELEIKMGFSEDLLDGLNQTVYQQAKRIEALHTMVQVLHQQISSSAAEGPRTPIDDLPPHY